MKFHACRLGKGWAVGQWGVCAWVSNSCQTEHNNLFPEWKSEAVMLVGFEGRIAKAAAWALNKVGVERACVEYQREEEERSRQFKELTGQIRRED